MKPFSLASDFGTNVSISQRRATATIFAKSFILTMRKMQQSKYKEVAVPIPVSYIKKTMKVNNWTCIRNKRQYLQIKCQQPVTSIKCKQQMLRAKKFTQHTISLSLQLMSLSPLILCSCLSTATSIRLR